MKKNKIILFGIFLVIASLLVGCSKEVGEEIFKTEYFKEETATIDYYEIVYKGYSSKKEKLYVDFVIANHSEQEQEINLNEAFVLYTDNSQKIINSYDNKKIKIKSSETKEIRITITADELFEKKKLIDLDSYKIIFYSGVVSNNIAFIIDEKETE